MLDDLRVKSTSPFKPKILEKRVSPTRADKERFSKYDMKYLTTVSTLIADNIELIIDPYQKELIMH